MTTADTLRALRADVTALAVFVLELMLIGIACAVTLRSAQIILKWWLGL